MGLEIAAADYQGKIQIHSCPALTLHSRLGAIDQHPDDRRALQEIATETQHQIVRVFSSTCAGVEESDPPLARFAVHARAAEDRHRRAGGVETDVSRIEQLRTLRRADVEQATRLEKEFALLRKERRKSREIDHLLIGFDLREVRVERQIRCQRRSQRQLGVNAGLAGNF